MNQKRVGERCQLMTQKARQKRNGNEDNLEYLEGDQLLANKHVQKLRVPHRIIKLKHVIYVCLNLISFFTCTQLLVMQSLLSLLAPLSPFSPPSPLSPLSATSSYLPVLSSKSITYFCDPRTTKTKDQYPNSHSGKKKNDLKRKLIP